MLAAAEPERRNIVSFFADDQRYDTLGAAGHPIVRAPVIDHLAGEGVRFQSAFVSPSGICTSSR